MPVLCTDPVSVVSACVLAIGSAIVPAAVILVYAIFLLPWPANLRRLCRKLIRPFDTFITLQEAKATVALDDDKSTDNAEVTSHVLESPPAWKTSLLSGLAVVECLGWLSVGAYSLLAYTPSIGIEPWLAVAPLLLGLIWLIMAIIPVLRPCATPPYDLLVLYIINFASGCLMLGSRLFQWTAYNQELPLWWQTLLLVENVFVPVALIAVVMSMPMGLPGGEAEKAAIGRTLSPEDYATLFQWVTFNWITPLVWKGRSMTLNEEDVWALSPTLKSSVLYERYRDARRKTTLRTILATNSLDLSIDFLLTLFSVLCSYAGPFFLKRILDDITYPSPERRSLAFIYACLALLFTLLKAESDVLHLWHARRASTRIRSELMADIYDKALRRKDFSGITAPASVSDSKKGKEPTSSTQADVGKIVQLMSGDASKVAYMVTSIMFLYSAPFEITIGLIFLYQLLGWAAFAGLLILLLSVPLNTWQSRQAIAISKGLLGARDRRMGALTELIGGIKFIKFFAWETQWISRALEARQQELRWIVKGNINKFIFGFITDIVPVLVSVTSFYVFIAQGNKLTVSIAFTSIALFGMFNNSLYVVSDLVKLLQAGKLSSFRVSLGRIDAFLAEGEVPDYVSSLKRAPPMLSSPLDVRLGCDHATFRWNEPDDASIADNTNADPIGDEDPARRASELGSFQGLANTDMPFELKDITVSFPIGKLSIVTGPTASGKTALLMALLGKMTLLRGHVHIPKSPTQTDPAGLRNSISYAAQSPWLQHLSIKQNILFGSPLEEDRYDAVVTACALKPDFDMLEDGDQTEVGSRGVTLSGGQKARVALGRAVYARTKYVLLDDPLASLDSHTARHVFEHLFQGPLMKSRTVVLVTHHVELVLPSAYYLVRMLDGKIDSQGITAELREQGVLEQIKRDEQKEQSLPHSDEHSVEKISDAILGDSLTTATSVDVAKAKKPRQLVQEESKAQGSVKWKIYKTYLDASSIPVWIAVLSAIVLCQLLGIGAKYWIKVWGEHYDTKAESHYALVASLFHLSSKIDVPVLAIQRQFHFNSRLPAVAQDAALTAVTANVSAKIPLIFRTADTIPSLPSANTNPYFYIKIYAAIGIAAAGISALSSVFEYVATYKASKALFSRLLQTIVRAPVRWFDTTPSGRILNRLSSDMETIDVTLSSSLRMTSLWLATFFAALLTVGVVFPPFLIPAFFIGYAYYRLSLGYVNTGFAEMLDGLVTVRAFSAEQRFIRGLHQKIDATTNMFYCFWMLNRWLLLRFDTLGALAIFLTTLLALSGYVDAGLAGLTITSAMSFTMSVYFTCRMMTQLELDLNSVERVVEYLDIPAEPPAIIESNRPPASWPSHSQSNSFIVVEDLVIKYSPELEPVLHGISFKLAAREKIGLLGRTGSGKTTLGMSFLRFVDPTSGRIIIDGIDINKIGLQDLRSRITLIPQDAILFSGTIRDNLDPFGEHTDDECYDALHRVRLISESRYASRRPSRPPSRSGSPLHEHAVDTSDPTVVSSASVAAVPEARAIITLETQVSAGGANFSQGQRQLIAMARALLRQSSVIIMDEATASVDFETDAKIQATIREEFKNSLLLTIAHRIRTIIDYDRLIVLDAGRLVEFDTPHALLQKDSGIFKEMCLRSGMYQELVEAAERKA